MSAISETIVREYFERHGFFVRLQHKYIAPSRLEDQEADFFVWNPRAQSSDAPLPFVLSDGDLRYIPRATVVVKGWHTETFSPAGCSVCSVSAASPLLLPKESAEGSIHPMNTAPKLLRGRKEPPGYPPVSLPKTC